MLLCHLHPATIGLCLLASFFLAPPQPVEAHRPLTTKSSCDDDYGTSETALPVPDPTISWAFKHYVDCTHRAVWSSFVNPSPNFQFYVGVGVPPVERFEDVRANALIIGPGLPQLSEEEMASLPEEVRTDPVWTTTPNVGAYYHISPADQSTCDHLGTVMQGESTVRDGRCDFYEPFGQTNSWRVLDADNNNIPVEGATYHVVVFSQQNVSTKLGIALGTWVENFFTRFDLDAPTCMRDMSDFSEKEGDQTECFPKMSCSDVADDTTLGCAIDVTDADAAQPKVCELGQVCPDFLDLEICKAAIKPDERPMMGACGGERCPAAVKTWNAVNMKMHHGMMDYKYTGDADIDFVRQMIPHHIGAKHMCDGLLNLTCAEIDSIDSLDGLVHLCNHIDYEQQIEVGGMLKWLEERGLEAEAPCEFNTMDGMDGMTDLSMTRSANMDMAGDNMGMMMDMPKSCGALDSPSSAALLELNDKMMAIMAVDYSCDHSADFVRQMLPHHAAAIEMCQIVEETTEDEYIIELCSNITHTQHAEISWMHDWLTERDLAPAAPCGDCAEENFMQTPCEDLLSTSSFCHGLTAGQDGYCRCDDTITSDDFSCNAVSYLDGFGVFVPFTQCKRTCGLCPSNERSIWPHNCYSAMDMSTMEPEMGDMAGMGSVMMDEDEMGMDSLSASDASGARGWSCIGIFLYTAIGAASLLL